MQGIFRYALAHLVVLGHLWKGVWGHSLAHPGVYAVFAFYLLSGYLMSLTLNRTYSYTLLGTLRFFGNRALRIFPPYLCVVAATVLLLASPIDGMDVNPRIQLPDSAGSWLRNVFIFGLGDAFPGGRAEAHRLVPPAWSLDVELRFYLVMGLLLGRHRFIAIAWLVASVAYTVSLIASGSPWWFRYTPALAASLPFSLGAVLYHWREPLIRLLDRGVAWISGRLERRGFRVCEKRLRSWQALTVGVLFLAHAVIAGHLWARPMDAGFYLSLAVAAYLLLCLAALRIDELPPWLVALDRFLGNLSYPVFLCHSLAGLVVASLAFGWRYPSGGTLFWSSLILVNLVAYGIHAGAERPVERLRNALRPALVPDQEGAAGRADAQSRNSNAAPR